MSLMRRSPGGFSLTEILMAVGILGVGMTMVATIFPVAVDQTRRANDSTMAALCARSIAATIRANRFSFVDRHRTYFRELMADGTRANDRERAAEFGVAPATDGKSPIGNPGIVRDTANTLIARNLRIYNPNLFLYEAGRRYEPEKPTVTDPFWPMWNAGNYIPVLYVTPIVPPDARIYNGTGTSATAGLYNHDGGPFRVTIVVFKSRGSLVLTPNYLDGDRLHPRLKSWNQNAKTSTPPEPLFSASAGSYVIDRGRHAGEAYLIDFAHTDSTKTVKVGGNTLAANASDPPLLLACGAQAEPNRYFYAPTALTLTANPPNLWYPLPGAVAVFHTIIGD